MGNRAVITTKDNFQNNGIGIYLHWNGGYDSVTGFLTYCKIRGFRAPESDEYGWLYLAMVIGNFFGDGMSAGIEQVNGLDCHNGDNGVYFIENWKVVGREYAPSFEQNRIPLMDMVRAIDEAQPEEQQVGDKAIEKYFADNAAEIEEIKSWGNIPTSLKYKT